MTSRIAYNNPDSNGFFGLPYHYEMLTDEHRITTFRRAIERLSPGKRVLESGAGSGILSILAARAGAVAVYAVEKDPDVASFARRNIRDSGFGDFIRFFEADIRDITLDDLGGVPADVVLAENLSTWLVTEPQIAVMNHVNGHLAAPAAIRIPASVDHRVELACSKYRFEDCVELRTRYFGFSGIRKPALLSKPTTFCTVRFDKINDHHAEGDVRLTATRGGIINGLRLTSPLRIHERLVFRSSDSLMPPIIVPLAEDIVVREGDVVIVQFRIQYGGDWTRFEYEARVADSRKGTCRAAATLPLPTYV